LFSLSFANPVSGVADAVQKERLPAQERRSIGAEKLSAARDKMNFAQEKGRSTVRGDFPCSRNRLTHLERGVMSVDATWGNAGFRASRIKIQMTGWISMQEGSLFCNLMMPGIDEQRRKNLCNEADSIESCDCPAQHARPWFPTVSNVPSRQTSIGPQRLIAPLGSLGGRAFSRESLRVACAQRRKKISCSGQFLCVPPCSRALLQAGFRVLTITRNRLQDGTQAVHRSEPCRW
jgi:hypothetical protein